MDRLTNLLGAQALALTDRLHAAQPGQNAGLSASERAALVTLHAHPDHPVSWLGDVLGLTSSGVTRLVDRLVTQGWVVRQTAADARRRKVRLTATGRRRARAVLQARHDALAGVVAPLSQADRDALEHLLTKLVSGLTDDRLPALQVCRLCDRDACASAARTCPLEHTVDAQVTDARG